MSNRHVMRIRIITNMADVAVASSSGENLCETQLVDEENNEVEEPEKKKPKLENDQKKKAYNLEDRLNGILCCAVCLDLPNVAVYQVCIRHPLNFVA